MNLLIPELNELRVDKKFIGVPYKADGESLIAGVDCAGLSCLFLEHNEIELPSPKDFQLSIKEFIRKGKLINRKEELQPLDIILFKFASAYHVGIYIGYGKFLQQNVKTKSGICRLSNLWGNYFYAGIRPTELFYNNEELYNEIKDKRIEFVATAIAAIASAVAGFVAGAVGVAAGVGFSSFLVYNIAYAVAYVALYAGLYYGVSAISSSMTPKPNFGAGGAAEGSPRYSFGPLQNTSSSDLPVAILYGELKMAGNAVYQSDPGDTVYRCDVVCEGEINSFSDIKVNDMPLVELTGCSVTTYTGTASQTVDSIFSSKVPGLRNMAYLAITLQTSDKLRGGFPAVTSIVQGLKVETWDGIQWTSTKSFSDNPAACIRDFIVNTRYGIGLPRTLLDETSFGEVYDYCNVSVSNNTGSQEVRYTLNYVIDSKKPAIDILQDLLSVCGSFLVWSGNRLKLRAEKVENAVQNFTMSNIIEGSFSYQYVPKDDTPNRVRLMFIDPIQNYTKVYVLAEDKISQDERANVEGGNGIIEREISMLGVTKFSRASRLANLFMKISKTTPITCKFKAGIYSVHCEPGDVITVSHDVPAWVNKKFRIFAIEEEPNDEVSIVCKEYNESIYDDSYGSSIATYQYGTPANALKPPANPTSVTVSESGIIAKSGNFITILNVSWTAPSVTDFIQHYTVEYSKDGGDYLSAGTTTGTSLEIANVDEGSTYTIRVKSINYYGLASTGAISSPITVSGKSAPPDDVTAFSVSLSIDAYLFTWVEPSDVDLHGYEIREGNSWASGTVIATNITGNRYLYRPVSVGAHTFRIKAIDTSGNYSSNEDTDTITVTTAPDTNVVVTEYVWSRLTEPDVLSRASFSGEYSLEYTNRYNSEYNRKTLCLRTNQTFGEMQATGKTYTQFQSDPLIVGQPLVTGVNGRIETDVYDLTATFNTLTTFTVTTVNDEVGTLVKQINTSTDGITWSGWETWSNAEYYNMRYYKLALNFQTSSLTTNYFITDAVFVVDVPDVLATDGGNGIDIEAGGTNITFQRAFTVPPRSLVVSTVDASSNLTPIITNQTATGFTCTIYNVSDVSVAGKINFWAKGY